MQPSRNCLKKTSWKLTDYWQNINESIMKKLILVSISSFFLFLSWSQNGKDPVKVTDMLKIKTIGSLTLTKDGSKAAFTVTSIEPEENSQWEYKYVTQAWMVPTDGSAPP